MIAKKTKIIYPRQVQIFISEVCNEGCAYCPYTHLSDIDKKNNLNKELSIEQWKQTISYLHKEMGIKLVTLIGGEPAAKKGIENLISFIRKKFPKIEILFVTSGIPLLINKKLRDKLIQAGLKNFIISVDGIKKTPDLNINLQKELLTLKKGSDRKSLLGLYFLLNLRKMYPKTKFRLAAGCIVNKKTIDLLLATYRFLAKNKIYLNFCPEQTICFNNQSKNCLTSKDIIKVNKIAKKFIELKKQPNNYLINSKKFFEILPTIGINQSYRCSENSLPSSININSDGIIPFCNWQKGLINNFNILDLVNKKKGFNQWLALWKKDKIGKQCSCSWSFVDRVNDYHEQTKLTNFWHQFT